MSGCALVRKERQLAGFLPDRLGGGITCHAVRTRLMQSCTLLALLTIHLLCSFGYSAIGSDISSGGVVVRTAQSG